MAAVGLVNLAERLLNQNLDQQTNTPATTQSQGTNTQQDGAAATDQFTPSTQDPAQAARLFTVGQIAFFSAAAEFLLTQGGGQAAQANTPAPAPQNAGGTNTDANTPVTQAPTTQTTPANGDAAAITNVATNATNNTQTPADLQSQIQALNNALAALGLSQNDIQIVDRIASLVNDFNPAAFASFALQLEALAQGQSQPTQPSTNPATATNAAANGVNLAAAADAGGNVPNGAAGAQVQELVIRFAGVQAQETQNAGNANGQNANGNTVQVSAFNLQIEDVQLTLTNANGQQVQIQAPPTTTNTSAAQTAPLANAAAA